MKTIQGIAASSGIAQGKVFVWKKKHLSFQRIENAHPPEERERLERAIAKAEGEIRKIAEKTREEDHPQEAKVFEAHIMFLKDNKLHEYVHEALEDCVNAEQAWQDGINYFKDKISKIPDQTLSSRAADLQDVGDRVLRLLQGIENQVVPELERPCVLIADDLAPSETALIDKSKVLAFCTSKGGPTSHTAILAKALSIPAVVGLGDTLLNVKQNESIIVDGNDGIVIIDPDTHTTKIYSKTKKRQEKIQSVSVQNTHKPAISIDHHQVEIVANIGGVTEVDEALDMGAEGIGLLRTEFLFLDRSDCPDEDEQYQVYKKIIEKMQGRPVVVRTIDAGGDKNIPYLNMKSELNPFLGYRALRICLDNHDFFLTQLRALLRSGIGHDLRIMFPMVSTVDEVEQVKVLLDRAEEELEENSQAYHDKVQIGIMVENPSVVVMADKFAELVDFFSIGTNDLTQYTLAADRTNPKVAHLGDPLHPAIIRQVKHVIREGHQADIWVGMCGEMAGDLEAIPVLFGLGLDEFSMAPTQIPIAKELIRQLTQTKTRQLANECLELKSAREVRESVEKYLNQLNWRKE